MKKERMRKEKQSKKRKIKEGSKTESKPNKDRCRQID
jgi:hypothetical protein